VQENVNSLKYGLDLKWFIECYKKYFDNILIVPIEVLKDYVLE
jgi:hypothetical protein